MPPVYINRIATAVPEHDIHQPYLALARSFLPDARSKRLYDRMMERAEIDHRYAVFAAGDIEAGEVDASGFYRRGQFPGTSARMAQYEMHALRLAMRVSGTPALKLNASRITHLIVASCTGFSAPGLDIQLTLALGLRPTVSRTMIGFMGCAAAIPAMRAAHQTVSNNPDAQVLVINIELCSLHFQETASLADLLCFSLFADGCSAAIVSAQAEGLRIDDFHSQLIADSQDLITWQVGDSGFRMHLSGQVPARIASALGAEVQQPSAHGFLQGRPAVALDGWAVHGGGRSVLDAVESGLGIPAEALRVSRDVLRDFGNMSSATVMFTLARFLAQPAGVAAGKALAFGPGMVAESFSFTKAADDESQVSK